MDNKNVLNTPKSDIIFRDVTMSLKLNWLKVLLLLLWWIIMVIKNNYTTNWNVISICVTYFIFSKINACKERRCQFVSQHTLANMYLKYVNILYFIIFTYLCLRIRALEIGMEQYRLFVYKGKLPFIKYTFSSFKNF